MLKRVILVGILKKNLTYPIKALVGFMVMQKFFMMPVFLRMQAFFGKLRFLMVQKFMGILGFSAMQKFLGVPRFTATQEFMARRVFMVMLM
jgi:hypothetical protein